MWCWSQWNKQVGIRRWKNWRGNDVVIRGDDKHRKKQKTTKVKYQVDKIIAYFKRIVIINCYIQLNGLLDGVNKHETHCFSIQRFLKSVSNDRNEIREFFFILDVFIHYTCHIYNIELNIIYLYYSPSEIVLIITMIITWKFENYSWLFLRIFL